jgi:sodium-dependent dicarboxylate transporter 2/3/5
MPRRILIVLAIAVIIIVPVFAFDSPLLARAAVIAGICLVLWLSEAVPPFVPTFLLFTLTPLLLGSVDEKFSLDNVLTWAVDPVLALFFGGFVLGVAAHRFGLDERLAEFAVRAAGKSYAAFLLLVILLTAFLSMWMSNIAAASLMLACLRPILNDFESESLLRRTLLVGIAMGANLGGISTPIGTGSNAIAVAAIEPVRSISFLEWMFFAVPLAAGMIAVLFLILLLTAKKARGEWVEKIAGHSAAARQMAEDRWKQIAFSAILLATIVLWLTEPWHKVPAAVVSLGATSVLFFSQMLKAEDLLKIDWSTLLLIAGGITLGRILEQSELIKVLAGSVIWSEFNPTLALFLLCLASATLAALMSNTASVVILIPLAMTISPAPSTAILVAVAASFGLPFVVSTPPNAMVYGEGGVRFKDLFVPGIVLMLTGCLLVSLTGRFVLNLVGIP